MMVAFIEYIVSRRIGGLEIFPFVGRLILVVSRRIGGLEIIRLMTFLLS